MHQSHCSFDLTVKSSPKSHGFFDWPNQCEFVVQKLAAIELWLTKSPASFSLLNSNMLTFCTPSLMAEIFQSTIQTRSKKANKQNITKKKLNTNSSTKHSPLATQQKKKKSTLTSHPTTSITKQQHKAKQKKQTANT